ncbi:MAG: Integration host factor subunit beta [Candidatus Gallionella acididurans]|uniref:Integration host factor subunit beta n=1 Tax=Candidatus Gallionella acididurans TaxID=1796491 RepID=A0A139BW32_9PROT|nr:MAG: Integration host factor subunit beta [Candidatus Gallionella acididurans]
MFVSGEFHQRQPSGSLNKITTQSRSKISTPQPLKMIRSELISHLADKHPQYTASDVELAVKTIVDSIVNRLAKGGRVELKRFGSFSVRTRPPRLGRNPGTGEEVKVPEKSVLNFKPGTELRERVNKESA